MFLVIFSSVLSFELDIPAEAQGNVPVVTFSQYFVAGIMGVAIFGTSFNLLGNSLAVQQFDGTLKQLAAAPLPKSSFFLGLAGSSVLITIAQMIIMLALGVAAFGIELPDASGWLTMIWVLLLGVPAGCMLGVAITAVIPSARAAPAVIQVPFLVLQFISGVFFQLSTIPAWLQWIFRPPPPALGRPGPPLRLPPRRLQIRRARHELATRNRRRRPGNLDHPGPDRRNPNLQMGPLRLTPAHPSVIPAQAGTHAAGIPPHPAPTQHLLSSPHPSSPIHPSPLLETFEKVWKSPRR